MSKTRSYPVNRYSQNGFTFEVWALQNGTLQHACVEIDPSAGAWRYEAAERKAIAMYRATVFGQGARPKLVDPFAMFDE